MIRVACAVVVSESLVLAVQRSATMSRPLLWEFPGGKIEAGESAEDCVVREIYEELGFVIEPVRALKTTRHDYGAFQIELVPFLSVIRSGRLQLHEHSNYRWLPPKDLMTISWTEADLPVVQEVMLLLGSTT